ncbi:Acetoacetate decarboxylase (ADC) [Variovorax sp. PBL-H6]|uniref:acetoacetate decarboxylase family protein n=1 Tax=Variovorax sp. PBL-H6 TaxID=434009 RepID=UPI001315F6AC|nr:acetoacetate decarboxylase family protein [Variovorax sp. PBL-H6]VTU28690.1 Acetoacetate decarboxylase (ADC) [Variovorax sp. PBL-H6]
MNLGDLSRPGVLRRWWRVVWVALLVASSGAYGGPEADVFSRPTDFVGTYDPRPGPTWTGLQSTYSGTVVVTMIDREIVKKMLPDGLSLARLKPSVTGAAASKHPVVHLIGDQREPSTLFWGYPTQVGTGYEEMILLIPFVVRGPLGDRWHNYVPRMYLNNQTAVDGGNEFFGYAKELANLGRTENPGATTHTVSSPDLATTWFVDDIDTPAQWGSMPGVASTLARWNDIRSILEMPFLGLRPADVLAPAGIKRSALLICSYWELSYSNAMLAPTKSRHRIVTKFRDGMEDWVALGTLSSAQGGAVSMRDVRWRLAMPPQGC